MDAWGEDSAQLRDFRGNLICHLNRVRGRLASEVDEYGGNTIGGDGMVDGLGSRAYIRYVRDVYGSAGGGCLDHQR